MTNDSNITKQDICLDRRGSVGSRQLGENLISFEVSTTAKDLDWDRFLQGTPLGQFQQSSAWACYKKSEGWEIVRAVFRCDGAIIGGFQILWKKSKGMRLAYLSKGPVLLDQFEAISAWLIDTLKEIAAIQRFTAMIVQPPDCCALGLLREVEKADFLSAPFLGIIDSTILIKLDGGPTGVTSRFRSSTRNKRNKAVRNEMKLRFGNEDDLPAFFDLMKSTCARQGVLPNPPSLESLREMWSCMRPQKMIEVAFSVLDGELVSGELLIGFGARLSLFKTGWSGAHRALNPNIFMISQILERSSAGKYLEADFVGLERSLAETVLKGEKITQAQNASRDAFKLSFGGQPKLLPGPRLWVPNFLLRKSVGIAASIPFVKSRLSRLV